MFAFVKHLSDRRRRQLAWSRRGAALVCLALAGLSAYGQSGRAATARTDVLVAAHDLSAGTTLAGSDLRLQSWPAVSKPPGSLPQAAALGRRILTDVKSGEAITATRVLTGSDYAGRLAPGLIAAPVHIGGATGLVHAGDHVDLLAGVATGTGPGAGAASVLAENSEVLAVLPSPANTDNLGGGSELIVAVDQPAALRIASSAGLSVLATVRRRQ